MVLIRQYLNVFSYRDDTYYQEDKCVFNACADNKYTFYIIQNKIKSSVK